MHEVLNNAKFALSDLQHLLPNELPFDPFLPLTAGQAPMSDEIAQLNHLILQLQTRRAILFQHENTQHSPIFKLPSELLALIFQYADALDRPGSCRSSTRIRRHPLTPIRLGAVCAHWRRVAWNSPQLWTELPLSGCWAWEVKCPLTSVLDTYFYNVKAMSLDVFIDCFLGQFQITADHQGNEGRVPFEEAFNAIFVENAHKLRSLALKMWPNVWLRHIEKIKDTTTFSQLKHLSIKSEGAEFEDKLSFANAPCLRRVELTGIAGSPDILLPWTQITHLELSDLPSDLCLSLFLRCTNLEYFRCEELTSPTLGSRAALDPITFPHLNTFYYIDRDLSPAWREAMGRYLKFPALESLIWGPDWSGGVEKSMLRPSAGSIRTLEFQFRRRDQSRLKPMFSPLKSLEELKITCWPAIKLTTLELLTRQTNKKLQFLPSLRKLHFSARSNEMTPRIVESLLALIRSRRTLTDKKLDHLVLSFQVRHPKLYLWPPAFVEGIKELIRDGLHISIEAANEAVDLDWLRSNITDNDSRSTPSDILSDTEPISD